MKLLRAVSFGIATILLYLGVPLLGWGLGQLSEYFSSATRLAYALVVGLFGLAVGVQAYGSAAGIRGGRGEAEKFVFRQHVVRILLIITLYLALIIIPYFDRHAIAVLPRSTVFQSLGVALSAAGYTLIFLSGLALGKQYSQEVTIQQDHQLITQGVYHYIRHPRYLGIILLALGFSLIFSSWIGLAIFVLATGVLVFRVGDEEKVMHAQFGAQWEAYSRRSWRLLPYVY